MDDIFKCIFLNDNASIVIKISLNLVPKVLISIIPVLVQKMAWCWPGNKPLSDPIMVMYWCIYASLGLNVLNKENQCIIFVNIVIFFGTDLTQAEDNKDNNLCGHVLILIPFWDKIS